MAFLDWSDSLSVHYRLIDADHKKLVELINGLHALGESGATHSAIESSVKQLTDFLKAHFMHEETLMRKTAYPKVIPHKIEHDRLMKQLEDFGERFNAEQVGLSQDTVMFLRTWLCDHILEVDTPLGQWLAKLEQPTDNAPKT